MLSNWWMRAFWVRAWFATSVLHLFASSVLAQSGTDEYREYVDSALREYSLGNFSEAKALFAQAHARAPSARTFRGLGTCAFELRSYVEAIEWFEQALSASERPLTPEMRTEIQGLLRQARAFITRIRVSVEPAWAKIRVDARPVERDANGFIRIDPGTHELAFEAPNHETQMRTLRATGGEELTLDIVLTRRREAEPSVRQPEAAAAAPESVVAPAPAPEVPETSRSSVAPWIVIASSGAVAVTGAVFLALALSSKAAVEHPDGMLPRYDRAADEHRLEEQRIDGRSQRSSGARCHASRRAVPWQVLSCAGSIRAAQLD
jgi:tetratricopeptide (TPR) repeat protein